MIPRATRHGAFLRPLKGAASGGFLEPLTKRPDMMPVAMLPYAGVVPERGVRYGEGPRGRPVVEPDQTAPTPAQAPPAAVSGPQAAREPAGPNGDSLCAQDGHPVGGPAHRVRSEERRG